MGPKYLGDKLVVADLTESTDVVRAATAAASTRAKPSAGSLAARHLRAAIPPSIQQILAQLACQSPQLSRKMESTTTPTWFSSPPSGRMWSLVPKDLLAWILAMLQLPISADVAWKNMDYALSLTGGLRELFSPATSPRPSSSHKYKRGFARTTSTSTPPSRQSTSPKTSSRQTK